MTSGLQDHDSAPTLTVDGFLERIRLRGSMRTVGVMGEMGIASGGLGLDVAEDSSHAGEALPPCRRLRDEGMPQLTHHGSTGAMCEPMLSPTREPDAFTDSFARCAYRAVV